MTDPTFDRAVLDADVLYRAAIRDILLQLAKDDVYEAKWTAQIHSEWMKALHTNRPDIGIDRIDRLRAKMDAETRDPYVSGYERLIQDLHLPEDSDDRHVLAAAIAGKCQTIVTMNVKHFPASRLKPFDIVALHPDDFMLSLLEEDRDRFCASVRIVRRRLKNPEYSVDEYLENLAKAGLVQTAQTLRSLASLLD